MQDPIPIRSELGDYYMMHDTVPTHLSKSDRAVEWRVAPAARNDENVLAPAGIRIGGKSGNGSVTPYWVGSGTRSVGSMVCNIRSMRNLGQKVEPESLRGWERGGSPWNSAVGVGCSGSNVAGISGEVGSGHGFCGIVMDGFWNKIDGKGGKGASEEVVYEIEAVVAKEADGFWS